MAYRALRSMSVNGVEKQPGDMIPEAMDWANVRSWIEHGFIEEIDDPKPAAKPAAKKTSAAPPAKKTAAKRTSTKSTAKKTATRPKKKE